MSVIHQCKDCLWLLDMDESEVNCKSEGIRYVKELKRQIHCAAQQEKPKA